MREKTEIEDPRDKKEIEDPRDKKEIKAIGEQQEKKDKLEIEDHLGREDHLEFLDLVQSVNSFLQKQLNGFERPNDVVFTSKVLMILQKMLVGI